MLGQSWWNDTVGIFASLIIHRAIGFQCDVFELTKAGFFVEYEIKLSKSDFRADAKKEKTKFEWDDKARRFTYPPGDNKHRLLGERSIKGPCRFYFVCPAAVASEVDIPEWAGLIHCRLLPTYNPPHDVRVSVVRDAPNLHNEKANPNILQHAQTIPYWRLLNHLCGGSIGVDDQPHDYQI